jgi:putative transposase
MRSLVTIPEAAKILGVNEKTIRRKLAQHDIACTSREVIHIKGRFLEKLVDLVGLSVVLGRKDIALKSDLGNCTFESGEKGVTGHSDVQLPPENVQLPIPSTETQKPSSEGENLTQVQNVQLPPNVQLPSENVQSPPEELQILEPDAKPTPLIRDAEQISPEYRARAQQVANECAKLHEILLYTEHGQKEAAMEHTATTLEISVSQVRRYYSEWREHKSALALARKQRTDAGKVRIPSDLLELIESVCITNPTANPYRVRRLIQLVNPTVLRYHATPNSREKTSLSVSSISRIRSAMLEHPIKRFAFLDGKGRKEYLRSYSGEVVATNAAELYQADMTRCDCFVYDQETASAVRLRIHAVIDVFSGAIPSFVFSREENQRQTDRMVVLALMEKPGQWATRWNIYATPKRIYWDNGKTYKSSKSHMALESLGVEVIHSIPKVSHSRGKIERFFGTFHGTFEKMMQGYAGENAVQRDHDTIGRLTANTERWLEQGADPAKDPGRERLLLKEEYQAAALGWLCDDYHQTIVDGKTRAEWFIETCPAGQRIQYDFADLNVIMSERVERVVSSNGTVRYDNAEWGMRNAGLMRYQKQNIILLISDMMVTKQIQAAVVVGPNLSIIGTLEPMRWSALSKEAREHRQAQREEGKAIKLATQVFAAQYTDPQYRADKIFMRGTDVPDTKTIQLKATLNMQPEDPAALEQNAARAALEAEGWKFEEDIDL